MNDRIAIDPNICHGKPIVRGTRTPVTVILAALAGGDDVAQVAEDYEITEDAVRACIAFACDELEGQVYLLGSG